MPRRCISHRNVTNASLVIMVTSLAAAACSHAKTTPSVASRTTSSDGQNHLDRPLEGTPRFFHTAVDDSFWVSHSPERDRLISSGIRLEVSATNGEVFASAWETDNEISNGTLIGALEVPPRLGGGFIHWTRNQLFRSDTFTGPLRPITSKHMLGTDGIRGVRVGLDAVIVFGESSNGKLGANQMSLESPPFPGLLDFAALDEKRAVRLDATGRVHSTIDGGRTWIDATGSLGISTKQLLVEPGALSVTTWQGRWPLNADGTFGPLEPSFVGARRGPTFSTFFRDSRAEETNAWWTWRETAPAQAAVLSGARTDERHAWGLANGALGEIDLVTGNLTRALTDWPQAGLSCSTVGGPDAPLFICGWDTYQGYGSYVLHTNEGQWPPVIERSFTDDGYFVTDEHGALAFVGSCEVTPKYLDPNDMSRFEFNADGPRISNKICVRKSANEWVEHEITVEPDSILQGWAPLRDGTAVALVARKEGVLLPDVADDPTRVSTQGAIRIIRVPRDIGGFALAKPNWNPFGGSNRAPSGPFVERRLRVHDDGSISAWFSAGGNTDSSAGIHAGVSIDKRGNVTVFPAPPRAVTMIATSPFAIAMLGDGSLVETLDHGKTYRAAGSSPIPQSGISGYCTMLGCVMGTITRLGWGMPETNPTVYTSRLAPTDPPRSTVRLECSSFGTPDLVDDKLLHRGNRQTWTTPSGDGVSLFREVENAPDALPQVPQIPPGPDPDDPPPTPPVNVAPQTKSRKPTTRTQSLLVAGQFDPDALPKRLDATGSELDNVRRLGVFTLLGKDGDVGLLLISDKHEVLVMGDEVTTLPLFEQRRYLSDDVRNAPGLVLGPNHALIVADLRRRSAIEEHGMGTQRAPVFLGQERDSSMRKPMALARRDDGAQGVLVWDGFPAQLAAVSEIDTKSRTLLPFAPLAPWSTATMGDDPRCKNVHGWTALVPFEPAVWFDVKALATSGISLNTMGMLLVRWSSERLCIDAMNASVDTRTGYEWRYDNHLVVRWLASGKQRRGGVLFHDGTRRRLECRLTSPN